MLFEPTYILMGMGGGVERRGSVKPQEECTSQTEPGKGRHA